MACTRLLHVCAIHNQLGPLWITVRGMGTDVMRFSYLLVVCLTAFSAAFMVALRLTPLENDFNNFITTSFFLVSGIFSITRRRRKEEKRKKEEFFSLLALFTFSLILLTKYSFWGLC